jgi:membrane-associated phospholipid phosphatase
MNRPSAAERSAPVIVRVLVVVAACVVLFAALAADMEAGGAISRFDVRVAEWNAAHMPTAAEWAARPFSWVGGFVGIAIIVTVVSLALLRAGRRRDALVLIAATLVAQVAINGPKDVFARPRPEAGSAVPLPGSYSFPSGHALTAVVVFGLLASLWGRRVGYMAAAALALAIGASRVVLNVHYPSDVAAGFLLGLTILVLALAVRASRSSARPAQPPREPRRRAEERPIAH